MTDFDPAHSAEGQAAGIGEDTTAVREAPKRGLSTGAAMSIGAAGMLGVVALVGLVVWLASGLSPDDDAPGAAAVSPMAAARKACAEASPYITLGDGDKTLIIKTLGEESPGASMDQMDCVLKELEATDAIQSEMASTRALDGTKSGSWGTYKATWSYHPNSGVRMTITTS